MAFTREAVEQISSDRSEPTWLRKARLAAWKRFETTPMPDSSKDEDWRRTDISKLDLEAFTPALNGAEGITGMAGEVMKLGLGVMPLVQQVLQGNGKPEKDVLYSWTRDARGWTRLADLGALGIHGATRLAVSPKGDLIAIVAAGARQP